VNEIIVSAGRTFNHPYENYSNLRPQVTLKATVAESEDAAAAAKELQSMAETLVEDHKRSMLQSLEQLEQMRRADAEVSHLGRMISENQRAIERQRELLDEMAAKNPALAQRLLPAVAAEEGGEARDE
jgi:hypothetical protein